MKEYLALWIDFLQGILSLLVAILYPVVWLILSLLPYGILCLFTGMRLKKGYRYFYFLPSFIKTITKPLRNKKNKEEIYEQEAKKEM